MIKKVQKYSRKLCVLLLLCALALNGIPFDSVAVRAQKDNTKKQNEQIETDEDDVFADSEELDKQDSDSKENSANIPSSMQMQVMKEKNTIQKIVGKALADGEDGPEEPDPSDEDVYGYDTVHLAIQKIVSMETKLLETLQDEGQGIVTYKYEGETTVLEYIKDGKYAAGTIVATNAIEDYAIYDPQSDYTKLVVDNVVKIYDDALNEILPFTVDEKEKMVELRINDGAITSEPLSPAECAGTFNWVVQRALDYARDNEKKSKYSYKVILPKGEYIGEEPLHIYSNTTLDVTDSTIKATKYNRALLETGIAAHKNAKDGKTWKDHPSRDYKGYDYFKNISIVGGVWDGNGAEKSDYISSMFCIAHVTNFSMTGCTLQKTYNTHMIEIGATNGFVVKNCTFQNDCITDKESNSYEAIQLDVTHDRTDNFPHYYVEDDLATINVTVSGCTFSKLRRGIGNHHYVAGAYYDNVKVEGNTFENIEDKAILAPYWKNSVIKKNTMTNVGCAVKMKAVANKMYLPNNRVINAENIQFDADLNNVISDNVITLRNPNKSVGQYTPYGIYIGGVYVKEYKSASGLVPIGIYYVNNIRVENNTITGRAIAGVHYDYSKEGIIKGNQIDWDGAAKGSTMKGRGIETSYAELSIDNNVIKNTPSSGHGIAVYDESNISTIANNTLDNIGYNGIHVSGSNVLEITENILSNVSANGISIISDNENSRVGDLSKNKITTIGKYGVNVTSSSIRRMLENTISASQNYGIYLGSGAKVETLDKNTLTSCGNANRIYVGGSATNITSAVDYENAKYKLSKGDIAEFMPEVHSSYGVITYQSANNKIAKVDAATGMIKAVKTGTVEITATQNDSSATMKLKVVKAPTKITVPKKTITLKKGKTYQIVPKVNTAATCHIYTYKTSKKKIATVSKTGKIKAKKKGTATITVKTFNKKSVKIKVKVKKK